jgi:RNA polymerase sigma-70 factor (ECF subfamily)
MQRGAVSLKPTTGSPGGGFEMDERLTALVRVHYDFVWRLLRRSGVPRPETEDAAQQVFLVAHRRLSVIALGSERAFLAGTAVRVAADIRRGRRRRPADVEAEPDAVDLRPQPDELVEAHRARVLLDRLLASMPEELAAAFVLFEIEELSTREIGVALGIPKGTVASRLRRAREWFSDAVARERDRRAG